MDRFWGGFLVALVVTATASGAHAQAGEGAFRLSLDGALFAVRSTTFTSDATDAELDLSTQSFGLLVPMAGVSLGYQVSSRFLIGARFLYWTQTDSPEGDEDTTSSSFALLPHLELLIADTGTVRGFAQVALGYGGSSTSVGSAEITSTGPVFSGSLGLRLFATDSLSIDPMLTIAYSGGTIEQGGASADRSELAFTGAIALTGWIGGSGGEEGPDEVSRSGMLGPAPLEDVRPSAPSDPASERMTTRVALDGAALEVVGLPARDGRAVALRLVALVRQPELRGCAELAIEADGRRIVRGSAIYDSRPHHGGIEETLVAPVRAQDLAALGSAREARLVVCARSFDLPSFTRSRIDGFVERFHRQAVAFGTLESQAEAQGREAEASRGPAEAGEANGTPEGDVPEVDPAGAEAGEEAEPPAPPEIP